MPDDITIRISFKADGTAVIERANEQIKKTQKEVTALVPGLEKARGSLTSFVGQNAALIGVLAGVSAALVSAFKEYSRYAEAVRDFALVTGTSADEASRFIQVLDDYQLTVEDATTASRFLKEKGLVPNIDTLVMLADKFKGIEDPAKRLEFIQENLGRGGAKWVNILSQEGDALRANAAAISQNLIMSDEQIRKYEQQRLALDALSDSVQGWKVKIGAAIGEMILNNQVSSRATEILRENGKAYAVNQFGTQDYKDALAQARAEMEATTAATQDNTAAAVQNEEALKAQIEAQKELSDHLSGMIGLINNIQSADEQYTEKSKDLTDQRTETEAELAELRRQGYYEQGDQIQDTLQKLDDIKQAEADLAADRAEQTLQFVSNILSENLARKGWTEESFAAFADQQEAWGLWSADAVEKAKAAWTEADKITASINAIPTDKTVTITVQQLGGFDPGTAGYNNIAYAGRDAGGPGMAGRTYMIGTGAQPEMFTAPANGSFTPNADRNMIDYGKLARVFRDVLEGSGRI